MSEQKYNAVSPQPGGLLDLSKVSGPGILQCVELYPCAGKASWHRHKGVASFLFLCHSASNKMNMAHHHDASEKRRQFADAAQERACWRLW